MTTIDLTRHVIDELTPLDGPGEATSVARLVLEDVFKWRRGSHPRTLDQDEQLLAWTTINRLKAREPVQYVTGIADFYGLQLRVTPDVLIPRPETEELVEWILEENPRDESISVLDIGTGSGCIPLALKARRPRWTCTGVDVSPEALEVARDNAEELKLDVTFELYDVLAAPDGNRQPIADNRQLIVSNPPYIPPSEKDKMDASTLTHEPGLALFVPEDDPLIFYRLIAKEAGDLLTGGGKLYFETNEFNNDEVVSLLQSTGYAEVEARQDLSGKWRMVRGTWVG